MANTTAPFGNGLAIDLDTCVRHAACPLHGAVVAEQFLHGARREVGIVVESTQFHGMAQQSQHAVANQVDSSLMTSKEQQTAQIEELEFGHSPAASAAISLVTRSLCGRICYAQRVSRGSTR
jgi:hypothetical protein